MFHNQKGVPMGNKSVVISVVLVMASVTMVFSQAARTFNTGRIAIDHDGNSYDTDDFGASAFDWGIIAGFGMQKKLVHFQHSDNLSKDDANQHANMIISATAWKYFPGFDSSVVFDCYKNTAATIAHFKSVAEQSSANDRLYFICAGPMEMPWRCINAVEKTSRKFITCISHSSWNDNFNSGNCTHTWNSMKSSFSGDGVVFTHISDQNGNLGGGSNWSFLNNMPANTSIPASAWSWMASRDKKNGDVSDCGMTWYLMTGSQSGRPADFQARFKSPLPMEGVTAVEAPRAIEMKTINKDISAVSYQQMGKTLTITVSGISEPGTVCLYSLLSKKLCKTPMFRGQTQLDFKSRLTGTYIIKFESNSRIIVKRILLR
jgi:hypothetical protein